MPLAPHRTLALLAVLLAQLPTSALAHAVVLPDEAPVRAYQRYVLRVPNERGSPTVRIHIVFPSGVRVTAFEEVPGWTLETTSTDGGASFAAATWTGLLPEKRFVEFAFIGVNPAEPSTLAWPVVQTYADGFVAEWTGPEGSATPASITRVVAPATATPPAESGTGGAGPASTVLSAAALVLAVLALGLALRPRRES